MSDKYITQKELKLPPYNLTPDDADEIALGVLQDLTRQFIDNSCKQSFDQEGTELAPTEHRLDGTESDTVFVDKRLISLSKVRVYASESSYNEYTAENFYFKSSYVAWNVFTPGYGTGRLRIEDFPKGRRNIGVFGVWGWAAYPDPIKYAQGKLIMKILRDKTMAQKFSSESVGDYSYSLLKLENGITNDNEIDMILKQYEWWSMYVTT